MGDSHVGRVTGGRRKGDAPHGLTVRWPWLAGIAAGVAALAAGPVAEVDAQSAARIPIVPNVGIAGVNIGMPPQRVRAGVGAPARVVTQGSPARGQRITWLYPRLGLQVTFFRSRAAAPRVSVVQTDSPRAATARGAGPGSTVAEVRRAHPVARCYQPSRRDPTVWCAFPEVSPLRQTTFVVARGRVRGVVIGYGG